MEHSTTLLFIAITLQLTGATIAFGSVRRGERAGGWLLLCAAFVLMAARRIITLSGHLSPPLWGLRELFGVEDVVALASSLLLVAGVVLMRARFREWRRAATRATTLAATAAESEQRCRTQNEFLNSVLASLTHPFYVVDAHDYTVRLANAASHLNPHDGSGVTCYALTHGRDVPCEEAGETCPLALVRRTKAPVTVEHVHRLPDGSTRHVDVHGHPIFDERGEVVQMIEYNLDVTEQRLAERALRESETRWRTIVESEPECVKVLDAESRVVEMNPAGLEMIEATIEDVRGKPATDLVAEEDRAGFLEMVAGVFRGERRHLVFDMIGLGGRRLTLETVSVPFRDPADPGRVRYLLGVTRDITERKRAEEQANRLAAIVRSSDDAILGMDLEGVITSWNRGAEATYGYTADEIVGKKVTILAAPGRENELTSVSARLRAGLPVERYETRRRRKDGSEIEISLTVSPIRGEDGRVVAAAAISRDITERKRAEEQANRLAAIVRSSEDAILGVDLDGIVTSWNRGAQTVYGWTAEEIVGKPVSTLLVAGREHELSFLLGKILAGEGVERFEKKSLRKGGQEIDVALTVSPVRADDGRVVAAAAIARDITARRRLDEANASRLHLLRFAMEHPMEELLEEALNETERLTGSAVAFYHFVDDDQNVATLQNWSRRTKESFCGAQGEWLRDVLADAGVWADCVRQRHAVVHNDNGSLPNRCGVSEECATLVRELVVPVLRGERVAAVLGVGNKPVEYSEGDIEVASAMANLAWDIVERKRAEEALQESEEHLRRVYENSPLAYQSLDSEGRVIDINPAWCGLMGYARDEVIGRPMAQFLTPRSGDLFKKQFPLFKVYGEVHGVGFELVRKDGSRLEIEVDGRIGRDREGGFRQTYCILRDVTERKRLEKEMRRSAAAMEQAGEAIIITDTDAVIQYVNPAFTQVTGYTREEAIGQNPRVLQSGRHGKEFYAELWGALGRGERWTGRFTNRKKDGSLYEEEASIAPVRDESGTVVYYVAVKRDITRELEFQDHVNRVQKMEALGSFASGIAHDFNNLIMIIRGTTEYVIGRLDADDPLRSEASTILRSARQASELTGGLLSFARRQVLRPEVVRLDEVVRGILPMLRRLIPEHCEVRFESEPEVGHVRIDLTHVEQVLLNLCVNARDAMPDGGTLTLAVANAEVGEEFIASHPWAAAGRYVAVTVRDTGSGMDAETLSHIFEPFFTTKAVGRGTGLGLATAYGLVKQHGGVIDVASEPGRGSAFTIYLPQVEAPRSAPAPTRQAESLHGRGERVLVVEDQAELRRLLARTLEEFGYRAGEAADGAEALARIGAGPPPYDLILTDLVMPTMGGLDLYRRVRAEHHRLPLLISSGYGDMGDSYVLPDDPYLLFLAKPYEVAELARSVRSLLDRVAGEP
jgi:PAS domain S-box-containing protein